MSSIPSSDDNAPKQSYINDINDDSHSHATKDENVHVVMKKSDLSVLSVEAAPSLQDMTFKEYDQQVKAELKAEAEKDIPMPLSR